MRETDLYPPLKRFLEARGFAVKGEIGACDLLAVRGDQAPLVVELKTTLTLGLLMQAVERLSLTPSVYVAVPRSSPALKKRRRVLRLFRRLGLGLMAVELGFGRGVVEVLLDPGEPRPSMRRRTCARLLAEFSARQGDPDPGGSQGRRKRLTAYRQQALRLARFLQNNGPAKAAQAARCLDLPKARSILYRNVYGWFERRTTGVYALSAQGGRELPGWSGFSEPELDFPPRSE